METNKQNSLPLPGLISQIVNQAKPVDKKPQQPTPTPQKTGYIRPTLQHLPTLNKYRAYIGKYNERLVSINAEVESYNETVKKHKKGNTPKPETAKRIKTFLADSRKIYNNHEYNSLAAQFNAKHGLWLHKRVIKKVKPPTIQVFGAFLYAYSGQLIELNKVSDKASITHKRGLPRFELNPHEILSQMRNGAKNLDLCKRTIRNHRQRLEECGVLIDYEFHSHLRPVTLRFSPKILDILDEKTPKHQIPQNQEVTNSMGKEIPHDNVTTKAINKKKNKEGKVKNFSQDKEFAYAHNHKIVFYKSTTVRDAEILNAPDKKNQAAAEKFNENSEILREMILSPRDLALQLENGEYDYYKCIPLETLRSEASSGNLSEKEMQLLVIQEHFKYSGKLYRDNPAGSGDWGGWYKIMGDWEHDMLKKFTGKLFDKHSMVEKLQEWRWCIKSAKNWFNKNNWQQIPFPALYFDLTRRDKKLVSFVATGEFYKQKLKNDESYKKRKAARIARNDQHARNLSKLDTAVKKYMKKTYDLQQLTAYVNQNIPAYMYLLPKKIEQAESTPLVFDYLTMDAISKLKPKNNFN